MGEPFIRLENVRKVYRTRGEEFLAVSDVSLDIEAGELVSLVGPSGCGKTTVLKLLAGLHGHDGGELRIGAGQFEALDGVVTVRHRGHRVILRRHGAGSAH